MENLKDLSRELDASGIRKNSARSALWFKQNIKRLRDINRRDLLKDDTLEIAKEINPGMVYMFFYDAKHKETLPYYDRFPLIIMIDAAAGGFTGLNLHYLPPIVRYKFLRDLNDILTDKRYDDNTRFRITLNRLKGIRKFKEFEPCFKHYLTKQIRSNIVKVPASVWDMVVYLPTEHFSGAAKSKVWMESLKKVK